MTPKAKRTLQVVPVEKAVSLLRNLTGGLVKDTEENRAEVESEIAREGYFLLCDPSGVNGWLCVEPDRKTGYVKVSKVLRFEV